MIIKEFYTLATVEKDANLFTIVMLSESETSSSISIFAMQAETDSSLRSEWQSINCRF
jgi:hypothetical protein